MRTQPPATPEPLGRFQRVCPYCCKPLDWRLFGPDDAVERPFCDEHGPLKMWRVVDWRRQGVVAAAHLSEEVGSRLLETPLPLFLWRQACGRWKVATRSFRSRPPMLLSIDLAHLGHPPAIKLPPDVEPETPQRSVDATCGILGPVSEQAIIADLICHARPPSVLRVGL